MAVTLTDHGAAGRLVPSDVLERVVGEPVPLDQHLAIEGVVTGWCRWHVSPSRTDVVRLRQPGSRVLLLPSLHVLAVESVVAAGGEALDFDWEDSGALHLDRPAPAAVVVTFQHGWPLTPPDLVGVVLSVAGRAVANPLGLVQAQETRGPVSRSESYGASANDIGAVGLLESERAALERYRLR